MVESNIFINTIFYPKVKTKKKKDRKGWSSGSRRSVQKENGVQQEHLERKWSLEVAFKRQSRGTKRNTEKYIYPW